MLELFNEFESPMGLEPIYSTTDPDGNPATVGEEAARILRDNNKKIEEEINKKVDPGGLQKTLQDVYNQRAGMNTEIIIKPKVSLRQILTRDLCTFKYKCYNVVSGTPVLQAEPVAVNGICYSNFIDIANITNVEALSNNLNKIPAVLYFRDKDISTYLGCEYGNVQVLADWYKYSGTPSLANAKYVIIQLNTYVSASINYTTGLNKPVTASIYRPSLDTLDTSVLCNNTGGYYNLYNTNSLPVLFSTGTESDRYSEFININEVGNIEATSRNNISSGQEQLFPAILYFKDKDLSTYLGCEYGNSVILSSWNKYSNTPCYPDANYIIIQQNGVLSASYKSESITPYLERGRKIQTSRITDIKGLYQIVSGNLVFDETAVGMFNTGFVNVNRLDFIETNSKQTTGVPAILYFRDKTMSSYMGAEYGNANIGSTGWQKYTKYPDIPAGANYAIVQYNNDRALNVSAGVTYYSNVIDEAKKEEIAVRNIYNKEKNIYNVRDYGAKGDGVTDDVDAIQEAIDSCFKGGGGIVYLPIGIYRLNKVYTRTNPDGSSCTNHLFIPLSPRTYDVTSIKIKGEGSLNMAGLYVAFGTALLGTVQPNGTTLFSDYLPESNVLSSPISVIGSCYAESSEWIRLNCTRTMLEDINIVTKCCPNGYPVLSGIDFGYIGNCIIRNVSVRSNLVATSLHSPTPYGHVSAGIMMSKQYCDPHTTIYDTSVSGGFAYGLLSGEHCQGHAIDIQTCDNALVFAMSDHPNYFTSVSMHNCKNQITALPVNFGAFVTGSSKFKIEFMDLEMNGGQSPTDFNYQLAVKDPNNYLKGKLEYFYVKSGGSSGSFIWAVDGAANVVAIPMF